jgi:hypothetical protein
MEINNKIQVFIFPSSIEKSITLEQKYKYLFGGEIYFLKNNKDIIVNRLTENTKKKMFISSMFLKAIDDKRKISLSLSKKYIGKTTSRFYATITLNYDFTLKEQQTICDKFNLILNFHRDRYNDLFLNNFRDNGRKRISFDLAYTIINHIIDDMFLFE